MDEKRRMISIGELMVEMRQMGDGSYRLGFAGDTFNTAYYARILLERFLKSGNRFSDKKRGKNKNLEHSSESSSEKNALEQFPKVETRFSGKNCGETRRLEQFVDCPSETKTALEKGGNVSYFTCLGDDVYSAQMRQFIETHGISTAAIKTVKGKRPGLYLIHQEAGDRHFTYWRETSAARHLADDRTLLEQAIQEANIIYFSGITLGILSPQARTAFFDILQNCEGKFICFDPNIRPALWADAKELKATLSHVAQFCDIILPTYSDEAELFGDASPQHMAARYLALGAREVVVKNGREPAFAQNKDEQKELSPPLVEKVIDATGAGDSFNAAYISSRINGKNIYDAMRSGHLVASHVIRHPGAIIDKSQLNLS